MTTPEERVTRFFESYRHDFERFDVDAIASHFGFPCHVTGDGDAVDLRCVSDREEWLGTLTMLLDLYRKFGVRTANIISATTTAISDRVLQASMHWSLRNAADEEIYDFRALYTLAEIEGELRIVGIAHDEVPKIMALLARDP